MTAPQRIQLSRAKGWRKPEGAVVVARPSKWGNPFRVGEDVPRHARRFLVDPGDPNRTRILHSLHSLDEVYVRDREQAVDAYGWWLIQSPPLMLSLGELEGHDLACWCPLEDATGARGPCHADVLLQVANPEVVFPWGATQ